MPHFHYKRIKIGMGLKIKQNCQKSSVGATGTEKSGVLDNHLKMSTLQSWIDFAHFQACRRGSLVGIFRGDSEERPFNTRAWKAMGIENQKEQSPRPGSHGSCGIFINTQIEACFYDGVLL